MLGLFNFEIERQRKGRLLQTIATTALLLTAALCFRFIPALNDVLSGPPRYMRAFAATMGRQIANLVHREYPVLVLAGDTSACRSVNQSGAPDADDAIYVLTYSELSRSLCLSVYAKVANNSTAADVATFKSDTGDNYGRQFSETIHAVPLHRSLTVLSPEYLALLHWRAKLDPATFVNAGRSQRVTSPSAQISFADASISFADLRTEVAGHHEFINQVLLALMVLTFALTILSFAMLIVVYRRCAAQCSRYHFELRFQDFLKSDFAHIAKEAADLYQQQRQQLLGEMRLENTLRKERQETRLRLEGLMNAEKQADQHFRIQQALENDDLEQMHNLLHELQPHDLQKTPEERLHILLQSLKEYCTDSELQECEQEVLDTLHREGFRQARETVIQRHDQFRARFKQQQAEQQTLPSEPNPASDLQPHKR